MERLTLLIVLGASFLQGSGSQTRGALTPEVPGPGPALQQQEALMSTVLGSLDELRRSMWKEERVKPLVVQLAERVDALQRQVTDLTSQLSTLGNQFNGATDTTLRLLKNLAKATKANGRNVGTLWERLDGISKMQQLGETEHRSKTTQEIGNSRTTTSERSGEDKQNERRSESPGEIGKSRRAKSESSGKDKQNENRSRSTGEIGKSRSAKSESSRGDKQNKRLSESMEAVKATQGTTIESLGDLRPRGKERAVEPTGNVGGVRRTTSDSSGVQSTSPTFPTGKRKDTVKDAIRAMKSQRAILHAIAMCSKGNNANAAAISSLTKRVHALERYASPKDGALANTSKVIGSNFEKIRTRFGKIQTSQGKLNQEMAKKIRDLETTVLGLGVTLAGKQDKMIVETATVLLPYKYLGTAVRVDFKKKFTEPPEVYASISGFAMDPDHTSLKTESNESRIQNLLDSHIYAVQANFYAARIEPASNIDASGFSIRVYDGRDLLYSAFQWLQVEWIAIGK